MVDFANSNLCGASPEMNDVFKKLDEAASEIESKIDAAASEAKAAFENAQNELNNLTAKLQSIEIPELPKLNLQAEIKGLSELTPGTPAYLSSLAKITEEFESDLAAAGKDLGTLINDGLSAITSGGNICAAIPNIEKEAGSDNPATEKATNVLQAAVAPLTETVSTVTQNASVTEQTEEIEVDVAAAQTPLKTEATPLEEDAGAYSMVPEEQVKTISTSAGETKVVTKKVEKAEERKNVAPKSKSEGFVHVTQQVTMKVKADDGAITGTDDNGNTLYSVKLDHVPLDGSVSVTQFNLSPDEVTEFETKRLFRNETVIGYREYYGIHGEKLSNHPILKFLGYGYGITIKGKELTFATPYTIQGDHPGTLTSNTYRIHPARGNIFLSRMKGPKSGGFQRVDDTYNKRFKGFSFMIRYTHRSSYDPEPST